MQLAQFLHQVMTHPGNALGQVLSQDANLISRAITGHNVIGGAPAHPAMPPQVSTPTMEPKASPLGSPMLNHLYNVAVNHYNSNMGTHSAPLQAVPSSSVNWNLGPVNIPYAPQLHIQPPTNSQPGLSPFDTDTSTLDPFSFGSGNYFGTQHFNPQVRQ